MSDDTELSATENRIINGCDRLINGCRAWFTAGEYEHTGDRVKAVLGRTAGGGTAVFFTGGILYALGPWGWATGGLLLALGVWLSGRPGEDSEEDEEITPAAFLELVHDVARGGNVHLSAIREQLAEEHPGTDWHGPATRALCDAAGIRVRDGVRVPGAQPAVTTGIHKADLPPLPQPLSEGAVDDVDAGQYDNNNTNTGPQAEGLVLVPDMLKKARR